MYTIKRLVALPCRAFWEGLQEELVKDVLEIITVFSARLYGARNKKNQRLIDVMKKAVSDAELG